MGHPVRIIAMMLLYLFINDKTECRIIVNDDDVAYNAKKTKNIFVSFCFFAVGIKFKICQLLLQILWYFSSASKLQRRLT
jgi:hypothetical protein